MRTLKYAIALGAVAALGAPLASADVARGRALYENHCQLCHSSKVHKRERRIALNAEELQGIVADWQREQKLAWSREDIQDVVDYLRLTQYRY